MLILQITADSSKKVQMPIIRHITNAEAQNEGRLHEIRIGKVIKIEFLGSENIFYSQFVSRTRSTAPFEYSFRKMIFS